MSTIESYDVIVRRDAEQAYTFVFIGNNERVRAARLLRDLGKAKWWSEGAESLLRLNAPLSPERAERPRRRDAPGGRARR